jgi:hypothetical protein
MSRKKMRYERERKKKLEIEKGEMRMNRKRLQRLQEEDVN